jgi:hypothetical protein
MNKITDAEYEQARTVLRDRLLGTGHTVWLATPEGIAATLHLVMLMRIERLAVGPVSQVVDDEADRRADVGRDRPRWPR